MRTMGGILADPDGKGTVQRSFFPKRSIARMPCTTRSASISMTSLMTMVATVDAE